MRTFEYKGYDLDGRARRGLTEALDLKDAREKLAREGVLANRVVPAGQKPVWTGLGGRDPFSREVRSTMYRELAALLAAGLPIVKAMDILIEAPETGASRNALAGMRDAIREGASPADALGRAGRSVTAFETSLVTVGEKSGTLDKVLVQLADFLDEQQAIAERVRTAMIYPTFVFGLALVLIAAVFLVIFPRVAAFLEDVHIEVPGLTRFMMGLGNVVTIAAPVLAILVVAGLYLRRRSMRDPEKKWKFDRFDYRLPVIGMGRTMMANLRFAQTLSVLLQGGVPLVEAIPLSGRATGSAWLERLCDEAADSVRHGGSLADAVRNMPPLSGSLPGLIEAGEASGQIENLLRQAGERYRARWNRYVTRCLALMEPLVILALGVFVLLVALAVVLPIISMNEIIQ